MTDIADLVRDPELVPEFAHKVLDRIIADFRRPAYRAGLAAYMITFVVAARSGMRFAPAWLLAFSAGLATEKLYTVVRDIHWAAMCITEAGPFSDAQIAAALADADPCQD